MEQGQKQQSYATFPVFIKLLVVFIVFGLVPLIIVFLIFLWDNDVALKTIIGLAEKNPEQIHEKIQKIQHAFRIRMGFTFIFFSVLVFAGVLFSARILVRPLAQLLKGIRLLANGQYGTKIAIKSRDEYAIFADYFNEMSRQLKMMVEREKTIYRIKSEFITLAAHQLRTPLSAMKWTMRMLLDEDVGKINPEQKKMLENSYHANEKMIILTRDLLDVVKIEEGRFDYSFEYADIWEIIKNSIIEQMIVADKKGIKINLEKPEKSMPKIKIDPQKIKLALGNLLTNALNYTLTGGFIYITIGRYNTDYLEVKIKDTGVGIPKEQMPRLFTKFSRGSNVMRLQTEGSGLGLFIAKNIIKSHGGELWLESEEGKGTTAHFTLPMLEKLIPEKPEPFEEFVVGT